MSVQFEEENNFNINIRKKTLSSGGISDWLIKKRIAKDENSAKKLMIIITVVCFAVAIYFAVK